MSLSIAALATTVVPKLINLIPDQNKKAELAHEVTLRMLDISEKAVSIQTYKWVDAIVKLMGALMAFARPIGSFAAGAVAVYLNVKGIEISPAVEAVMMGLFPAWGVAREADKRTKRKIAEKYSTPETFD